MSYDISENSQFMVLPLLLNYSIQNSERHSVRSLILPWKQEVCSGFRYDKLCKDTK